MTFLTDFLEIAVGFFDICDEFPLDIQRVFWYYFIGSWRYFISFMELFHRFLGDIS